MAVNIWGIGFHSPHQGHYIQAAVAIFLIIYGLIFTKVPKVLHYIIAGGSAAAVIFMSFLFVYGRLGRVTHTEDAVIVLGAGLSGGRPGAHLSRRLNTAILYLNENENAVVVVSGGLGAGEIITEAAAMEIFLIERGIAAERIFLEYRSTSTYENLTFSHEILTDLFPGGYRAVIVTNDFHIFRALRLAEGRGIDAVPLAATTPRRSFAINYLREMFAVLYMWVFRS